VPADTDGRVLAEMFTPGFRAGLPVASAPAGTPTAQPAAVALTGEDEAVVAQRLRELGYLE
jgi:hypothetical protein